MEEEMRKAREREDVSDFSDFSSLPEDVVANILSMTTPSDACRSSTVSKTFHAAAQSDIVWDRFLPSDWKPLISRRKPSNLNTNPISSSKEVFFSLCHSHLLTDDGNKSLSLEKCSGKKCIMLGARDLSITRGNDFSHWRREPHPCSRFAEVAILLNVWGIEIRGRINRRMLSPKTTYAVYFVSNVGQHDCYEALKYPADATVGRLGCENHRKRVFLSPYFEGLKRPPRRHDGWFEIELGKFESGEGDDEIEVALLEVKGTLVVEGIEIRPKLLNLFGL